MWRSTDVPTRDSETLLPSLHQPAAAEWHSQSFKGKKEEKGEDKSLLQSGKETKILRFHPRVRKGKGFSSGQDTGETPMPRTTSPPSNISYFYWRGCWRTWFWCVEARRSLMPHPRTSQMCPRRPGRARQPWASLHMAEKGKPFLRNGFQRLGRICTSGSFFPHRYDRA